MALYGVHASSIYPLGSRHVGQAVCVCRDRSSILAARGVGDVYLMSPIFASVLVWCVLVIGCLSSIAFLRQALSFFLSLRVGPSGSTSFIAVKSQGKEGKKLHGVTSGGLNSQKWRDGAEGEGESVLECGGERVAPLKGCTEAKHGRFSQISAGEYLMQTGVFI